MSQAVGATVFLDRDGTLIRDVDYLCRVEQIELLPRVPAALALLREYGFKLVVITNQSAVARGHLTEAELGVIHAALIQQLARCGAALDAIYYCPHHPTEGIGVYKVPCGCRKPNTGMVELAVKQLGSNPIASYVVGDQWIDLEITGRSGATGVLIDGVKGGLRARAYACPVVADLWQAARWIVEHADATVKQVVQP
jgi:D-glycero-D-manno-heptose 1,7-bisphosphate phosphatase